MKKISLLLILVLFCSIMVGCGTTEISENQYTVENGLVVASKTELPKEITATIKTNFGDISLTLDPKKAPLAVENFITLAKQGDYDGTSFYRIVADMMIQGGNPVKTDSIWSKPFAVEWSADTRIDSGALVMANSNGKNTSQFFIVDTQTVWNQEYFDSAKKNGTEIPDEVIQKYVGQTGLWWLDGQYTVFGWVTEGQEIVHEIANLPCLEGTDAPTQSVQITTIEITEK